MTEKKNGKVFKQISETLQKTEESIHRLTDKEISPGKIAQILKKTFRLKPASLYLPIRKAYLQKRKELLDTSFKFTPENIEKLIRVNQILTENSQKVLAQAKKLYDQLQAQTCDFTQDFEIEGTVRVSYNGDSSLIDFDPEKEEICGESKYSHIAEIIDSTMADCYFKNLYYCHYNDNSKPNMCEEKDIFWAFSLDTVPLIEGVSFCSAFHNLADHTLYALQDIVRINDFWNEVKVRYQNFNGDV